MTSMRGTAHGFRFGPALVQALSHLRVGRRESYVMGVETDHHKVEVYVSATGRSVRVWRDGKELS